MEKQLIFIDIDGTLITYEAVLPKSALEALEKARANGHKIVLCTGRSKAENSEEITSIPIDAYIGGNGNYIEVDGEDVFHQTLSKEECKAVVDWLHENKLEFYLESNNGLFGSENFEEEAVDAIREYAHRKGKSDYEHLKVRDIFPDMIFGAELYRDDVNKISFVLSTYDDHLRSKEKFTNLEANTWGGAGEKALFGDLGVKNITKATAVQKVVDELNWDIKNTMAFGDAKIDIPMLEATEIGVAMASGGEEIKAMADYITDGVDEDGLYNAFKHFGLI